MIQVKIFFTIVFFGCAAFLLGNQGTAQQCTAIKVPESINQPVWVNGKKTKPPVEISKAFVPVLSTVQLPRGFKAVGGGDGFVIACR